MNNQVSKALALCVVIGMFPVFAEDECPDQTKGNPWEARAIIGYHQAGASSARSTQHVFVDFYVARPLGACPAVYANKWSLWGDVRIASAPQQVSVPLSQFVADFAKILGKVPVNELAQSGEFLTGIERRVLKWEPKDRARTLGLIAFFGANGGFEDAGKLARIVKAPARESGQWDNFVEQFPQFGGSTPRFRPDGVGKYLALVPPDRERFYRQYGAGIRYTSYDTSGGESKAPPPSMYSATIGQDQMITGGFYRDTVLKFDAF